MATKRRVVIGIGNADRGDDGVGHEVIRLLSGRVPLDVVLLRLTGEATLLLDRLQDADAAYVIDAAASGAAPGTVHRYDVAAGALPVGHEATSSHGLGLAQAIELARALDALPRRCVIYAIEGQGFAIDAPLTPAVARAATSAAEQLLCELTPPGSSG